MLWPKSPRSQPSIKSTLWRSVPIATDMYDCFAVEWTPTIPKSILHFLPSKKTLLTFTTTNNLLRRKTVVLRLMVRNSNLFSLPSCPCPTVNFFLPRPPSSFTFAPFPCCRKKRSLILHELDHSYSQKSVPWPYKTETVSPGRGRIHKNHKSFRFKLITLPGITSLTG